MKLFAKYIRRITHTRPLRSKSQSRSRVHISTPHITRRRRYIWAFKGTLVLCGVVGLFLLGSIVSFASFIGVHTIQVQGTTTIHPTALRVVALKTTENPLFFGFFSQQNSVMFPVQKVREKIIDTFPRIASVTVSKRLIAHRVDITVVQRIPYARWCPTKIIPLIHTLPLVPGVAPIKKPLKNNEGVPRTIDTSACLTLDRSGYLFETYAPQEKGMPTVVMTIVTQNSTTTPSLKTYIGKGYFKSLVQFLDTLKDMQLIPRRIVLINSTEARVYLQDGWSIKIALNSDLGVATFNLRALLANSTALGSLQTLEYIDMRFGNRVYVKHR